MDSWVNCQPYWLSAIQKNRAPKRPILFFRRTRLFADQTITQRAGHRLDGSCQAALVASSLRLVKHVLVGNAVDAAGGLAENFVGSTLVAGFDGLTHTVDRR